MIPIIAVERLTCEYRENPLGIDETRPRLSWRLHSERRGARQIGYQLEAASSKDAFTSDADLLWESGRVDSEQSVHVDYQGPALRSGQRIWWRVRVWDDRGEVSDWSEPAWWEIGLLDRDDWQGEWIGAGLVGGARTTIPSPYLRRQFALAQPPLSARLYITALGLYECHLNGQRVGEDVLAPGWTDYRTRIRYQTYDVTGLLHAGDNAIGAILGDGWCCGNVSWLGRQLYADRPRLLAQLVIEQSDGSILTIVSDESWKTAFGPILESDLLMGESYDARLDFPGWDSPGFDDSNWSPAVVFPDTGAALVASNSPLIHHQQAIVPIADPERRPGWPLDTWIFDFGQNLVGRVRLKISGAAGTTITLRHGEVLDERGDLYTANLRSARQTDYYTLRGDGEETYEPYFTFHGFRYVEVKGYVGVPDRDMLTAVVLHSDLPVTGAFECSDPLVNQLQHNIVWGQKGNFIDIPTDCPQRDERLGWTGDAQVFADTAAFNMNVAGFFDKWMQDLVDAQLPSGGIPPVVPVVPTLQFDGGPAWSDGFLIIPWTIHQRYDDRRLLARHYDAYKRFLDFLLATSPGLIRSDVDLDALPENERWLAGGFGDWLAMDGGEDRPGRTPKSLIGTAFFAHSARLMAKMAGALNRKEDAEKYEKLAEAVRDAFVNRFVTGQGLVVGLTQTAYVLALHFDLLPENLRPAAAKALVDDIKAHDMHLTTGFVGTPYLLHVLTDIGRIDMAYALLMQKTFPSWLFPVTLGATTIWERWDGWTPERGFQDAGMNSFNHYAYGSVGAWLYQTVAGIDTGPNQPGYKQVILRPRPGGGFTYARASYESPYGLIVSDWRWEDGDFIWRVRIPPNTDAIAHLPCDRDAEIFEGNRPVGDVEGVQLIARTDAEARLSLLSGDYQFSTRLTRPI
jgi:alpha-L-rhamnosidase